MKAHYDDPEFFYEKYWKNRDYEHKSEEMVILGFLNNLQVDTAADIGGGYGRLAALLSKFSKNVYLVEPSVKQTTVAEKYIKGLPIKILNTTSDATGIKTSGLDLIVMVRVSHHLPNMEPTIQEFERILKPGGKLILEIANSMHLKARILHKLHNHVITRGPVERRSSLNIKRGTIDFVNHHPETIYGLLEKNGFKILEKKSVSNFRLPILKKVLPLSMLMKLENIAQKRFEKVGPSIFVYAEKKNH